MDGPTGTPIETYAYDDDDATGNRLRLTKRLTKDTHNWPN